MDQLVYQIRVVTFGMNSNRKRFFVNEVKQLCGVTIDLHLICVMLRFDMDYIES